MTGWSRDELARFGGADEIEVTSRRPDGTLRPFVTIWIARLGDELYVRSAYGPDNGWFRRAGESGLGRIRAGGAERDVAFAAPDHAIDADLDAAYRAKYGHYPPRIVETVVTADAAGATLRLEPG